MLWKSERARIASLTRSRDPNDPDLINARRNLKAIRLEEHVLSKVSTAPFLTMGQLETIAKLLKWSAE
jgi:hypothetical protein